MIIDERRCGHKSHVKKFCLSKKMFKSKCDYLFGVSVGLFKLSDSLCLPFIMFSSYKYKHLYHLPVTIIIYTVVQQYIFVLISFIFVKNLALCILVMSLIYFFWRKEKPEYQSLITVPSVQIELQFIIQSFFIHSESSYYIVSC